MENLSGGEYFDFDFFFIDVIMLHIVAVAGRQTTRQLCSAHMFWKSVTTSFHISAYVDLKKSKIKIRSMMICMSMTAKKCIACSSVNVLDISAF